MLSRRLESLRSSYSATSIEAGVRRSATDSRHPYGRPSLVDVIGYERLRPITVRATQRSRQRNSDVAAREQLEQIKLALTKSTSTGDYSESARARGVCM